MVSLPGTGRVRDAREVSDVELQLLIARAAANVRGWRKIFFMVLKGYKAGSLQNNKIIKFAVVRM